MHVTKKGPSELSYSTEAEVGHCESRHRSITRSACCAASPNLHHGWLWYRCSICMLCCLAQSAPGLTLLSLLELHAVLPRPICTRVDFAIIARSACCAASPNLHQG